MSRLRPVHMLSREEAELVSAIRAEPPAYELCNGEGARKLKARIEAYWSERGYAVNVRLVKGEFVMAMRSSRFDVRSDMINGMPVQRAESVAE